MHSQKLADKPAGQQSLRLNLAQLATYLTLPQGLDMTDRPWHLSTDKQSNYQRTSE
ncbi:hypothetical protein [Weissella cibaria]|uniref:hypothetical protein n=1 Tax=Weissella cibaria TaxID=137591 RepID=UPI001C94A0EC|nr:hypothetical protein [Weissella cibaria]